MSTAVKPTTTTTTTTTTTSSSPPTMDHRPALVRDALANDQPLYYFGLGSNMLRSKLEGRSADGKKIEVMSFEPAVVPGHRLSFNLRGFIPLEPAMGALEPVDSSDASLSVPLVKYHKPECHGALVKLTPENYERVMRSEGVGTSPAPRGYEEIVVTAVPYGNDATPVQAIALRAKPLSRLPKDACPSARYMKLLREGAAELGLQHCYQEFLASIPVQETPKWLRHLAVNNMVFTLTMSAGFAGQSMVREIQSWFLHRAYVPSTAPRLQRTVSDVAVASVLLPGSIFGVLIRTFKYYTKSEYSPFLKRILSLIHEHENTAPQSADAKA